FFFYTITKQLHPSIEAEEEAARQGTVLEEMGVGTSESNDTLLSSPGDVPMNSFGDGWGPISRSNSKQGNITSENQLANNGSNDVVAVRSPSASPQKRGKGSKHADNEHASHNKIDPMESFNLQTGNKGSFFFLKKKLRQQSNDVVEKAIGIYSAWKRTSTTLTSACSEANDNVKFLQKLRPFVEPLYSESRSAICESLPALFNNLKMIFTLSRYYSTKTRMTNLLTTITYQLCQKCRERSYCGGSSRDMWEKQPQEVLASMQKNKNVHEKYRLQFFVSPFYF
ncbi:hypothetical protein RFI_14967, partial [Reticulomyxa filosa]